MSLRTDEELPFSLEYEDGPSIALDLMHIHMRGRRIRVWRRVRVAVSAAAVVVLVASGTGFAVNVFTTRTPTVQVGTGGTKNVLDAYLSEHPPTSHKPVALDDQTAGWTTEAWLSTDKRFCYVAYREGSPSEGGGHCEIPPPQTATSDSTTSIDFPFSPMYPAASKHAIPLIGLVNGPATRVEITMFGTTVAAPITRLSSSSGAYFAWVPAQGHSSYNSTDIASIVTEDASGTLLGLWTPPPSTP